MKLEKFSKNKKTKQIIIGGLVILLLLIGGITLYRTFALYEEKKEFNVLKGNIPDEKMTIIAKIDGNIVASIPEKKGYLFDKVECDNNVEAEWDNESWELINITNPNNILHKVCSVNFQRIKPQSYTVKATVNNNVTIPGYYPNGECYNSSRVQSECQNFDVRNYSILTVSASWDHWVRYGCGGTHNASVTPVGFSASLFENSPGGGGNMGDTQIYDISSIDSIQVCATSTSTGDTTVQIDLSN